MSAHDRPPPPEAGEPDPARDPVEALAEEFLARRRRGEHATVSDYANRHPQMAAEILDVFPTLLEIEMAGGTPASPATRHEAIPVQIADYRILREIGRGGMGVVYEAEQVSLGRRVALKVLKLSGLGEERHIERFRREARAAAGLHHSHIVPVHGTGEADGFLYYAMQFIDGRNLGEVLEEVRRLRTVAGDPWAGAGSSGAEPGPTASTSTSALFGDGTPVSESGPQAYFRRVATIARQGAEALAYAHEEGILHRDVKPSNLLLDVKGNVWITDFGLAKTEGSSDITLTGDVVGTIAYLAPERLDGWCDPRSDVYSLGLTLYELLTLRRAFPQATRAEVLEAVARREPVAPRKILPSIPRDLETIVLKAVDKSPAFRYGSAREMAADLGRFLEIRPILAKRASTVLRTWRWCQRSPLTAGFAVATVALLATLAVGATLTALRLREERNAARLAQEDAAQRSVDAMIAAARWRREARRSGQRFESRRELEAIAAVRKDSTVATEAVACFGRFDFAVERQHDIDYPVLGFDRTLERYAIGRPDGSVEVRELDDGRVETRVALSDPAPYSVNTLYFSPSGAYLAVGLDKPGGYEVGIVDPRDGTEILRRPSAGGGLALDFAPDERHVALRGENGGIDVLSLPDLASPARRVTPPGTYHPTVLRYDPDGVRLAAMQHPGRPSVLIWNLETARLEKMLIHGAIPHFLAWHPSGKLLAVAASDHHLYLWEVESERMVARLSGHQAEVARVVFNPSGEIVATTSWDTTTRFYEVATGTLLAHGPGSLISWGPDGRQAGFVLHRTIGRWQIAPGDELLRWRFRVGGKGPRALAISPDGELIAGACGSEGLQVMLTGGGPRWRLEEGTVQDATFLPDGRGLVAGARKTLLFPVERSGNLVRFAPPRVLLETGKAVAVSSDGEFVAGGDEEGNVAIVDLHGRSQPRRAGRVPNLTRLALSRGGRWVAVAANFPVRAAVLDALSGGEVHAILEGTGHLAFSPEGSRLFLGAEAEIRALEVGTWDLVWSCPREYGGGQGGMIAVSRDSRLIFAGLSKSRVGLLEAATGRELVQFSLTGGGDVSSLAIADRSKLAIASTRDSFELWDLVEVERDLERYQLTLGLRREEPRAARQTTAIEVSGATGPLAEDIGPRLERGGKIEGLTQVIQSDPRSPDGYAERAETLRRSGLRLEAIADLARALERKPREPAPLLLRRAKLLEAEGRFEECAADALRALELDAGLIAARKLRAAALERLGDEAGALREWEAAREAAPTDPVVMERIAWILLTGPEELRHPERALSLARGALFADPGRQAAQRTLGIACWRSGLAAEARSALERAAAHPEADAFTWFFLSMARARGGDAAGAEQAFARGTARLAEAERLSTFPRPSLLRLQEIRAEAAQAPSG